MPLTWRVTGYLTQLTSNGMFQRHVDNLHSSLERLRITNPEWREEQS